MVVLSPKLVWIVFDLGVSGDYEGLYRWLDSRGAKECGPSVAVMEYEGKGRAVVDFVTDEIKKNVTVDSNTRIYIIYRDDDDSVHGKFIFGGRKRAPWFGYSMLDTSEDIGW